ncbi:MAG: M4 family metallopeptidase [Oscillospiraceae bacterium]|jgi:Zn-dependent metalloprotease|nr:M4 family metallopeptidase [Oscillospiraceae bacterium]
MEEVLGVSTNDDGFATSISGRLLFNVNFDITPTVSIEEAKQIVKNEFNVGVLEHKETELLIHYGTTGNSTASLVWFVHTDSKVPSEVWVDAHTGEVVSASDSTTSGGSTGFEYSITVINLILDEEITVPLSKSGDSQYVLKHPTTNISVIDGVGNLPIASESKESFPDLALAAAVQVNKSHDFFYAISNHSSSRWGEYIYGGNVIDVSSVLNGYDDGEDATIDREKGLLLFGNRDGKSLATDIAYVAHEYAHLVSYHYGIIYRRVEEWGAIHEAYSDIFGVLVYLKYRENSGYNISDIDWRFGAYTYNDKLMCFRDLANPSAPNQDKGNPEQHIRGLRISHAAYLMWKNGISVNNLIQIWFNSYNYYEEFNETQFSFENCRKAVIWAAGEIYGKNSAIALVVKEAFDMSFNECAKECAYKCTHECSHDKFVSCGHKHDVEDGHSNINIFLINGNRFVTDLDISLT